MSYDTADHTRTSGKWLDGGVLELRTRIGTIEAYQWDGLVIEQGRRVMLRLAWVDEQGGAIDLSSGYTAAMHIRTVRDSATAALLSLTHASGITLAATKNNITAEITAAQSAALTFGRAFYELTVTHTATSTVFRLLQGACRLSRRATA